MARCLAELIEGIPGLAVLGPPEGVWVEGLECRPAHAGPGQLFAVIDEFLEAGQWQQGRDALERVLARSPAALLSTAQVPGFGGLQLLHPQPRALLGHLARAFTGAPDRQLRVYGVTGTNGKTTTARVLAQLLEALGMPCASLGTLGFCQGGALLEPSDFTTDLAPELWRRLARARDLGSAAAAIEVSSHALELDRVCGLRFHARLLTQVTRDHLDFHGSLEAYVAAKRSLFTEDHGAGLCVLNRDDRHWADFAGVAGGTVFSYGQHELADLRIADVAADLHGTRFTLDHRGERHACHVPLVGAFQVSNVAAAVAALLGEGVALGQIAPLLGDLEPVPGRMEALRLASGAVALIDYAHNPAGLENLLVQARALRPRRLLLVFGCGGDRDPGKRPLMGRLAGASADRVWVTSDNPRTEPPEAILDAIVRGIDAPQASVSVEADRARAIALACAEAGPGDLLLVAGKGHECIQIVGTNRKPFSDREQVLRWGGAAGQLSEA